MDFHTFGLITEQNTVMEMSDFDQIEYVDNDISYIDSHATLNETFLESRMMPSDGDPLPSYSSFVANLISAKAADCFENVKNSTTFITSIENLIRNCNCETCSIAHPNNGDEAKSIDYMNLTNINFLYDFTRHWNEVEITTYLEFARDANGTHDSTTEQHQHGEIVKNSIANSEDIEDMEFIAE